MCQMSPPSDRWHRKVSAKMKTYTGNAKYLKQWDDTLDKPSFSALEELGVQRAAELDGVSQCFADGCTKCVIVSAQTVSNGESEMLQSQLQIVCSAQAVIEGE